MIMIRAIFTYGDFEEIHILSALGNSDTTELDNLEQLIESYVDDFEEVEGLEIVKEYGKLYLFNEEDADIHELVEFEERLKYEENVIYNGKIYYRKSIHK